MGAWGGRLLALVASVAVLDSTGCSSTTEFRDEADCYPTVRLEGREYVANSGLGRPSALGDALAHPARTDACVGAPARDVIAYEIQGIPVDIAVYAPEAYGERYIMVGSESDLDAKYLQFLTKGPATASGSP